MELREERFIAAEPCGMMEREMNKTREKDVLLSESDGNDANQSTNQQTEKKKDIE